MATAGRHPAALRGLSPDGQGSALAGCANYGYCASHSRWYWGLKLYLVTTLEGMPITWCLADPKLGEREVAAELLQHARDHDLLVTSMVLIGDKGFAGADFHQQMTDLRITFLRPDRRSEAYRHGSLGGIRQRIESIFDTLKGHLGLEQHSGRTPKACSPASLNASSPWP